MSNKVPQIRFNGYSDAWEERKLGDITKISTGKLDANAMVENGKYDFYTSGIKKYRIDVAAFEGPSITIAGNGATVGYMHLADNKFNAYQRTYVLQEFLVDRSFIFSEIGNKLPKKIKQEARTGNIPYIVMDMLTELKLSIPQNNSEQQKIGSFFKQLDDTIALHQRKLDLLKEQKKGYLQKMFPKNGAKVPELRFAGFADAWEQCKWIDTVDMSTNMVDPKTGKYDKLLHIGPGNIESFTGRILDNVNTVKDDNLISGKFYFNPNDIIYGKINPQLAKYTHVNFEGLASADAYVLNSKNEITQDFLYVELQTSEFYKYSVSVSMRTGMPKINRDELNQFSYLAPKNIEEQQKIGVFFKQLDSTITLHQRKLDLLKEQKKGFLQKMFV